MKKKWINLLLSGLITTSCAAQTDGYKFYSKLESVKTSGFYNIEITPELSAYLKTDYSDIRIVNDSGKWVPHILRIPRRDYSATPIMMDLKFSISENSAANTELLIEKGGNIMSNLGLVISNTEAERFCTLSGSNDKKKWFVINDSILLYPVPKDNAAENFITIRFPASNYFFYKIVIHNKNKDPFNIKNIVENRFFPPPLSKIVDNPPTRLLQKDSGKISYIKVTQEQSYQFASVSLQLSGVKYYNRQVDIYIPFDHTHSFSNPGQLVHSFDVSNNSTLQSILPRTKAPVFYLLIRNNDNLPLKVTQVITSDVNHYITAYLEKGNNYRLIIDNNTASLPDYDLSILSTKIDSIPFLNFGKIVAFDESENVSVKANNNKWILWLAIGAALLILLFFTYKMMKEVDKRKTT
ncbi:MAG: hypothetical protein ABI685_12155 [Ferruginibacter sp.]